MCYHDFITSFAVTTSEIGMNGHESDVQDTACNEGVSCNNRRGTK